MAQQENLPSLNVGPVPTSVRVLIVAEGTAIGFEQTTPTGVFVTFWDPEMAEEISTQLAGALAVIKGEDTTPKLEVVGGGLLLPPSADPKVP